MTTLKAKLTRDHAQRRLAGSTLLTTVAAISILAFAAAYVCRIVSSRYRQLFQADAWHEALTGAEAGADIAIATLSSGDWTGWSAPDAKGARTYTMPELKQAGEGSISVVANVVVDSPPSFTTRSGKFYRIRSTGRAAIPGGGYVGYDRYDNRLRRLSLRQDRDTGAAVAKGPVVSRTIEVVAQSSAIFTRSLLLSDAYTPKSSSNLLDSYDSADPTKSTNGLYDETKRQSNGHLLINNSAGTNLLGSSIYGNLAYTGPTIPNTQGVKGTITSPVSEKIVPVEKPAWTVLTGNFGPIIASTVLKAGPVGSPTLYKASSIQLGTGGLIQMAPPASGTTGEIELWVTGDIQMTGGAQIVVPKGVKATVWFEGNLRAAGSVATNDNGRASEMVFNGVTPKDNSPRSITFSGDSSTIAAFNAPAYNISVGGASAFYGGFVAKSLSFNNLKGEVHYDEALGRQNGGGAYYTVASFTEDVR